ncbi:MAG: Tad domain-containing protein [Planctomycetes bacterium]|nr:Tad domain-containing protein [Planctomycetota bacterium]
MYGSTRYRGAVAPLVAVLFIVLMGFVALAVDTGFIFNSRGEMQNAVDAGALAGAGALEIGDAEAETRARDTTKHNGVAGATVTDEEIVATVGYWSGVDLVFTPAIGGETVRPNAIRVVANRLNQGLLFAHVIGVGTTDIGREAVGALGSGFCGGVWGLNGITGNGNIYTDSYNPDDGPYGTNDLYPNGDLCSNADIDLNGSVEIYGDVMYGDGYDIDIAGGAYEVWGVVDDQSENMIPPMFDMDAAMLNNDNASIGLTDGGGDPFNGEWDLNLHGMENLTLDGGTYYFTSASMTGQSTITVNGPTEIFVSGNASFTGGGIINATQDPGNLTIYSTGAELVLTGTAGFYGTVIAPETEVTLVGTSDYYGVIIAGTLNISGNSGIHIDESALVEIFGEDSIAPVLVR